jgi:hypothetical protein
MDELQLIRDFRSQTPEPAADSVRAARAALAARIAGRTPWWRRRVLVAITVALIAAVGAGAALGLGDRLVDLIRGKPAPDTFQKMMAVSFRQPVFGYELAGEWKGVTATPTEIGPLGIWANPTTNGGLCWQAVVVDPEITVVRGHLTGACSARSWPPGGTWQGERLGLFQFVTVTSYYDCGRFPGAGTPTRKAFPLLLGRAANNVATVVAHLRGGNRMRLQVHDSFFLTTIQTTTSVTRVTALDSQGRPVGNATPTRPTFEGGCL